MEKLYIQEISKQQEKLDEQLKSAQNQQYVEYVATKLDDILKYQQQENQNLLTSQVLAQQTSDLLELSGELELRFQKTIQSLFSKQDQLENDQLVWKQNLQKSEQQQIQQLDQEQLNIDKAFKEKLRNLY